MTGLDQQTLISRVTEALAPDERVRALLLSGSFGRGTADEWSDVDLIALVPKEQQEGFAADWRGVLAAIMPVVYFQRLPFAPVLHAVGENWLRCDMMYLAPDQTHGLTQDRHKALLDRDGIHATLPKTLPPPEIDRGRLQGTVNEFIRVLGLTPVGVGRGETELVCLGTGMLRRMLSDLMVLEMNHADTGGILHLSRLLDDERMGVLAKIPMPEWSIPSALAAQAETAKAFMPRAKALYARLGLDWPAAFEAATLGRLQREVPEAGFGWQ